MVSGVDPLYQLLHFQEFFQPLVKPSWKGCKSRTIWTGIRVLSLIHAKSLQSCPTLCNPIDGSPPGSPIPGILQARTLEWVAMPSSRGSSLPRDQTGNLLHLLHWQAGSLPLAPLYFPWKKVKVKSLSHVQLFATPRTVAYQAPLSMGILQARILEWVAMLSSKGSSQPNDRPRSYYTLQMDSLPAELPGKPVIPHIRQ